MKHCPMGVHGKPALPADYVNWLESQINYKLSFVIFCKHLHYTLDCYNSFNVYLLCHHSVLDIANALLELLPFLQTRRLGNDTTCSLKELLQMRSLSVYETTRVIHRLFDLTKRLHGSDLVLGNISQEDIVMKVSKRGHVSV